MNFAPVENIASAILYEGYILYPYRPTAIKNRQRWNFGTLYPVTYAEAQRSQEPYRFISEIPFVVRDSASLHLKISFLQMLAPSEARRENHVPTDLSLDWDEAVERSYEKELHVEPLLTSPSITILDADAEIRTELSVSATRLASGACRLHIELANKTELPPEVNVGREQVLPLSLVSAHMLVGICGGEFVSLLETPSPFTADADKCFNQGVFPVLAGEQSDRSMILISPIILYDYPRTAPESAGDFFDGTEMDEMLTLRVLTLTEEEKAEMRTGDSRARNLLERTEALTHSQMLDVHGVIRQMKALHPGSAEGA